MEINFIYKGKNHIISCNTSDKFKDVCENFVKKNSLNIDNILFINNGTKINLDLDLYVEEEFSEKIHHNKKKNKVDVFVFDESPFKIKFLDKNGTVILDVKENDKMKDILKKYASKDKKKLSNIFFLYNGESYTYKTIGNKTVFTLANQLDKTSKVMSITVNEYELNPQDNKAYQNSISIVNKLDLNISINEGLNRNIMRRKNCFRFNAKIKFFIKNFIILIIQYISIFLFTYFGFFYKINETILKIDLNMILKIISIIIIILIIISIFIKILPKYKKNRAMIIFHILYPFIITYYSFLASKYLDYYYILMGLSFITTDILSLGITSIIFKKDAIINFFITALILNIVGLIIVSKFFIPNSHIIIFSCFIFSIFILYILWIYTSKKLCKLDEYFYSTLIFNYGIFLGTFYSIWYIAKKIYSFLKNRQNHFDFNNPTTKIYTILFFQYHLIIISVWIGFYFKLNEFIQKNFSVFHWLFWPQTFLILIMCIIFISSIENPSNDKCWYFYHIIYIPIMISYYFSISYFIDVDYILSFLYIIFFDLLSILLVIFLFQTNHLGFMLLTFFITNTSLLILFHFYWFKNIVSTLYILSILAFLIIIYLIITSNISKKFYGNCINFSVILFNYTFFGLIFAISFGVIFLSICLLYIFLSCIKNIICSDKGKYYNP